MVARVGALRLHPPGVHGTACRLRVPVMPLENIVEPLFQQHVAGARGPVRARSGQGRAGRGIRHGRLRTRLIGILLRWGSLRGIEVSSFYWMRAARILPSLMLALAIIVLLGLLDVPFFNNGDARPPLPASYFGVALLSILTFWHNVLMQSAGYFNYCLNVYWSLSALGCCQCR